MEERRVELKILENFPKFIHVTDVYIHKIKEFIFFPFLYFDFVMFHYIFLIFQNSKVAGFANAVILL